MGLSNNKVDSPIFVSERNDKVALLDSFILFRDYALKTCTDYVHSEGAKATVGISSQSTSDNVHCVLSLRRCFAQLSMTFRVWCYLLCRQTYSEAAAGGHDYI